MEEFLYMMDSGTLFTSKFKTRQQLMTNVDDEIVLTMTITMSYTVL